VSSFCYVKKYEADPSAREVRDAVLRDKISEVWKDRKGPRTTVTDDLEVMPSELLERCSDAVAPGLRWRTLRTRTRFPAVYTAFVMDLFAWRILGCQVANHLRSDLALDTLEIAI
jgi:putative transposase